MTSRPSPLIPQTISRRRFIAAGAALAGMALGAVPGRAVGEKAKPRKPWTVACRDTYLKYAGAADCWRAAKTLGVAGLEVEVTLDLRCHVLHHPTKKYRMDSREAIATLRDDLKAQGLMITSFCMHNRFDERLEKEIAACAKLVEACQALRVNVIRIDMVPRKIKREEYLPFAIDAGKKLCALTAGTPVRYGIENHGSTTNDPVFLKRLFAGVGSKQLGLTLDPMNLYWYGHPLDDVYRICQELAPRTYHTHTKNLRYPAEQKNKRRPMGWEYRTYSRPIYDGDIDYRKIVTILREAGYANDLCLENESLHHFPREKQLSVLQREIALLKRLCV